MTKIMGTTNNLGNMSKDYCQNTPSLLNQLQIQKRCESFIIVFWYSSGIIGGIFVSGAAFDKRMMMVNDGDGDGMPKICVEIPQDIVDDVNAHVGDDKKFVNFSDAVRTALRKMLDQLDEIDRRHGRLTEGKK